MGAAAFLLLGKEAHPLKAIIADSSFASGETLVSHFDRWFQLPSFPFAYAVPLAVHLTLGIKPSDLAPIRQVGAVSPTALLFIHGEIDEGIPPEDAIALHKAAGEPKELWIIRGSGHAAAWGDARGEDKQRLVDFWRRYLG